MDSVDLWINLLITARSLRGGSIARSLKGNPTNLKVNREIAYAKNFCFAAFSVLNSYIQQTRA